MVLVVYFLLFFGCTMPVPLAVEAWNPNSGPPAKSWFGQLLMGPRNHLFNQLPEGLECRWFTIGFEKSGSRLALQAPSSSPAYVGELSPESEDGRREEKVGSGRGDRRGL